MTPVLPDRLVVVDENLDSRLGSQLEQRGRRAMSLDRLGLAGTKDEPLLRAIAELDEADPILLTGDDDMPQEHGALIRALGLTIATVDGQVGAGWGREEWKKETVHRWAHVINAQDPRRIERYSPHHHAEWRPRIRRRRS